MNDHEKRIQDIMEKEGVNRSMAGQILTMESGGDLVNPDGTPYYKPKEYTPEEEFEYKVDLYMKYFKVGREEAVAGVLRHQKKGRSKK